MTKVNELDVNVSRKLRVCVFFGRDACVSTGVYACAMLDVLTSALSEYKRGTFLLGEGGKGKWLRAGSKEGDSTRGGKDFFFPI